jgi:poly-gamma-glutamate system protein
VTRPLVPLPAWLPTTLGIALTGALTVILAGVVPAPWWWPLTPLAPASGPAIEAAADRAESSVRQAARLIYLAKTKAGVFVDQGGPPEQIALIGSEWTPLVTTLGSLEAKRLAASPAWARVLTREFARAGVGQGSVVAAVFSGSFPGLNLAVSCAVQALGARLIAVSSVTASTWGATDPGFTWPEIEARLVDDGVIRPVSVAISIGGDGDRGLELEAEARTMAESILERAARRLGAQRLRPPSVAAAMQQRVEILATHARGRPFAVFVNVGGTTAALGRNEGVLRLRTGWLTDASPADLGDGLLGYYARRGTRVLHLLNIRDLAARWGLS